MIYYLGDRGLLYERWPTYTSDLSAFSLTSASAGYESKVVDSSAITGNMVIPKQAQTSRLSGFFKAPHDGDYKFYIETEGQAILYFGNTTADKVRGMVCYIREKNAFTWIIGSTVDDF